MRPLINLFGQLLSLQTRQFRKALKNPQAAQLSLQKELLHCLSQSEYGKFLGIVGETYPDIQQVWNRIPIVNYDRLEPWILGGYHSHQKNATAGAKPFPTESLLTPEPILFYEKTSGSRGPAKWIPYTQSLRESFNSMFCVWAQDLIQNGPRFATGKLYFCISPQLGNPATEATAAIALQDDSDYLDPWLRWILRPFWISPSLDRLQEPEEFKQRLCLALLQEPRLEIISIWSPSFLKVQLDYIENHRNWLVEKLGKRISSDRAKLLWQNPIPWTQVWPELKLISCWDSASAAEQARFLKQLFPGVMVQGKGLLATEGPITVPSIAARGFLPVLDRVFFEFESDRDRIYQLHEIEIGEEYEIIISQKGGLYRYRLGDRIRVTHVCEKTPCLEFLGRSNSTSDLVGEKLPEAFVADTLDSLNLTSAFFKSLVPVTEPVNRYILLLDAACEPAEAIATRLETALMRSTHYRQARLLGQLDPVRVLISPLIPDIVTRYKTQSGKKWGDLKPEILAIAPIDAQLLAQVEKVCENSV